MYVYNNICLCIYECIPGDSDVVSLVDIVVLSAIVPDVEGQIERVTSLHIVCAQSLLGILRNRHTQRAVREPCVIIDSSDRDYVVSCMIVWIL